MEKMRREIKLKKYVFVMSLLGAMTVGGFLASIGSFPLLKTSIAVADTIQSFFYINYGEQADNYRIVRGRVELQGSRRGVYEIYKTEILNRDQAWVYCRRIGRSAIPGTGTFGDM